jgi:hypothetical protein
MSRFSELGSGEETAGGRRGPWQKQQHHREKRQGQGLLLVYDPFFFVGGEVDTG